jgi:hemoglobin-like flavoprotein
LDLNASTRARATQLFEESYTRVFGSSIGITPAGEAFFKRFYERFFAASPRVPLLFSQTDMDHQIQMLKKSLYQVVALYITDMITDYLREIAERHRVLDIDPDLYDVWLDCLMDTVREFDSQCDMVTELAWRLALTPAITYMKLWAGSTSSPLRGP